MHSAIQKLSDEKKLMCYELALESCLHTLMCLPADQVLKSMIRRDLHSIIEKSGVTADSPDADHIRAAIALFN